MLALSAVVMMAGAVELPRKSPPLEIAQVSGKPLNVAGYKGKPLLLAFILTTCPHCQHTTVLLESFQREYAPRGLQIVEAAIDQNAASQVPGFLQRFSPDFPVGYVSYDTAAAYLQHDPKLIMHVPSLVFIDRAGTIRAEYEGDATFFAEEVQEKNLRAEIEKILTPAKTVRKTASK